MLLTVNRFLLLFTLSLLSSFSMLAQNPVLLEVEEMPRFPGCEKMDANAAAKKQCADQKLLEFIYSNIKYPEAARLKSVEGMVVVSFIVNHKGAIKNIEILRDPGSGLGAEAKRVVGLMRKLPRRWTPGRHDGKFVNVQYNLPVRFKLGPVKKEKEERSTRT